MAIKIGKDGTLYCHSIKYNWKQARNMIADGCGAIAATYPTANPWSLKPLIYTSGGYHCGNCFKFYGTYTSLQQSLPKPISGHKYFFGCMYECDHASGGGSISIYGTTFSLATAKTSYWTKKSYIITFSGSSSGSWYFTLRASVSGSSASASIRVCKLMLIDLTDTFGDGNEPTIAWCEQNIREWDTYTDLVRSTLLTSRGVSTSNYELKSGNPYYSAAFSGAASYNYLQLDSNWEPREYMWKVDSNTSNVEAFIYNTTNITLYTYKKYYMYAEVCNSDFMSYLIGTSFDGYFPIAEPALGSMQENCNKIMCGGGGMARWKRHSFCNSRTSFTNGSRNTFRFDYNNNGRNYDCRITGLSLVPLTGETDYLYTYGGANNCYVTANDINKSWCDRWIDHVSSPIIHIKDHQNTSIKFNKPLFEWKSQASTEATQTTLDSYVGKTNFTLSNIVNLGDWNGDMDGYSYFTVKNTTNNTTCRFVVQVVDWIDDSTVEVNMLGYGSSGSFWWSFCDGYDIQCNDIEIRPEVNKVTFNRNTGTIICKKLILDTNATEGKVSQRLGVKNQIGYYEISSDEISVELFNPNCVEVTAHVEFYDCDDTLNGSDTFTISPNSWGAGYFSLNSSGEYQQGHYIKYYFTSSDSYYIQSPTSTFSD